jgi:Tfp pilus assembly protein PilF
MRAALEKILAQGRDDALLRFGLGNACLKEGDAQAAAEHLTQATRHNPAYSAAWKLLGTALRDAGRLDDAQAAWEAGLKIADQHGDMQSFKEMTVFLKRLAKQRAQDQSDTSAAD